jgi:putative lipoic acid-binding regulatory protein
MSKGYVILAQNNDKNDYVKMAYVAAMSIKISQSLVKNVTLITDVPDAVPHHYRKAFDQILPIIWYDDALNSEWKIENRWKIYHITPYEQTVVIDSDMLFLTDISHWWNYFEKNHNLFITDKVMTYRNEEITSDYYRKTFTSNKLPNTYSAFTYFKKSEEAEIFWKLVEIIVKNWKEFYQKYLESNKPSHLSIDVAFALAVKILGYEDKVFSKFDYPTFTHMKARGQNWRQFKDSWMDIVTVYFNDKCQLKIGNYSQEGIFHYTEKNFLNDNVYYNYEKLFKEGQ